MKFIRGKTRIKYGGATTNRDDFEAIQSVLERNWWTIDSEGQQLEKELADFTGMKYATLTNSGSSALMVAYASLGLPEESEVITGAVHFPTTISSLYYNRLKPVYVDIEPDTLGIDPDLIEKAITDKTKAILVVAIAGSIPKLDEIIEIAKNHNLITILDNCIAEGISIKTNKGDVPIENIQIGDMVLTRKGYRKVTKKWDKGFQKVITRFGVTATPDHKFITKEGKKELQNLNPSDILYLWDQKSSSIKEISIIDIPNQGIETKKSIGIAPIKDGDTYTDISMKTTLGKFLKDISFTTKTIIHSIMNYQTYSVLLQNNTLAYTSQKKEDLISQKEISLSQEKELLNGINQKKVKSFMQNITNGFGLLERNFSKGASLAKKNTQHIIPTNQNIVAQNVKRVFDLSVQGEHEFFANGVLVSNCDGFGGTYKDKPLESYFDISVTSFHAAHILCMGEGGAVFTNNPKWGEKAASLREWGRLGGYDGIDDKKKLKGIPEDYPARYLFQYMGFNVKPLELQCAMGRVQLRKLPFIKERRLYNYQRLFKALDNIPQLILPEYNADASWFGFPMFAQRRGTLREFLEKRNIETRTIFGGNITKQPAFRNFGTIATKLPIADKVMSEGMFVSVHPDVTDEMCDYIIESIKEFYKC